MMSAAETAPQPPETPEDSSAAELTYEQAIAQLETIIDRIEQGEVGLEESLAEYRRGAALLRRCRGILDVAEQQIEELTAGQAEEKDQ